MLTSGKFFILRRSSYFFRQENPTEKFKASSKESVVADLFADKARRVGIRKTGF